MKRKLFFICLLSVVCIVGMAQEITRFYFAGYRVVVIPSEEFRIDIKHPELGEKKVKEKTWKHRDKGKYIESEVDRCGRKNAQGYCHRVYQCYSRDKDGLFGVGHGEGIHG